MKFKTLHELLKAAHDDLIWAESHPGLTIDMDTWVYKADASPCRVCLAGAMLARRLGDGVLEQAVDISPSELEGDERNEMYAVDALRCGMIEDAVNWFYEDRPDGHCFPYVPIANYGNDPETFHRDIQGLISRLEQMGI